MHQLYGPQLCNMYIAKGPQASTYHLVSARMVKYGFLSRRATKEEVRNGVKERKAARLRRSTGL